MNKNNNSKLTTYSKTLRKNMTKEERHLWYDFLKKVPQTIHRQKVMGDYIVDFYCANAKIVIELDGSQHYSDAGIMVDKIRDKFFEEQGIKVLRYSNREVNSNFNGVCEDILSYLNTSSVSSC